jgi:hypothetical protein
MKTRTIFTTLLLLMAVSASAQLANFNGTWKIDATKSQIPEMLYLSQISIIVKGDSLITTRTYSNPNGEEYPFTERMTLNDKESKTVIYDMPRVTKARKNSDLTIGIESKTTFYGDSGEQALVAKEIWKTDGKTITLDQVTQMSGHEYKGVFYYNKVK